MPHKAETIPGPRILAWELTRRCNLNCVHCRASSLDDIDERELTTGEVISVLDDILTVARPLLILTGGEPMLRDDLYDIIAAARERGFSVAVAPNGTLLDEPAARKMVALGVHRISISLDGPTARSHDAFRGVVGAYDAVLRACEACRSTGLPFQINTTLTASTLDHVEEMVDLAARLGAVALHTFTTVPVGRAGDMSAEELAAPLADEFLERLCDVYERSPVPMRVTCAPQFYRVLRGRAPAPTSAPSGHPGSVGSDSFSRGCIAGTRYLFISATGNIQPCGYLPLSCGNLIEQRFIDILRNSEVLRNLRNPDALRGKCGGCDMAVVCGGCRARAWALTGDYLAADPYCTYLPGQNQK